MTVSHDGWADHLGELLRLLDSSDVEELEVEHEGARLVIRRDVSDNSAATAAAPRAIPGARPETFVVTSPIVGLFHRVAGGADPPAEEGASVAAGQVVGAVEAMGMLSRVQTERAGVIQEVLVRDGQPVEYGQPLVVLRVP
ncbi:MAG: acetyl-CoA carboxylase biotin carboxyl carrier protein [Chloroflexota bacterium]|nr:acetyl-CoA carboxylase biotin carboxyl carrier protein [Chloroflexota bacterium]